MPKSKRNKIVHLSQVKKKGKDHREELSKQVETYCSQFKRLYLFDFDKTKSDRIMELRLKLKQHGRIFAGKNNIMTSILNKKKSNNKNFDNLVEQIVGHKGILFTDLKNDQLIKLLSDELPEFNPKLISHAEIPAKSKVSPIAKE